MNGSACDLRAVQRVTLWGLVANLALAALKFVFGILGNCQALIADAVHSLSDMVTDLAILFGAPLWSAPPDAEHPHGHGRIETAITLFIGAALAVVGVGLAHRAVMTLVRHQEASPGWIALAAACISIVTKEALCRWTAREGRRLRSPAVVANAWHHRSDALSSIPVAIAVIGTRLHPAWWFLDQIATVIVAVFILSAAWKISWPAIGQLVDTGAAREKREAILTLVRATDGVRDMHALRTRSIGAGFQIDLHMLVDPGLTVREGHSIAGAVKARLLREIPDVVDVLIHVEPHEPGER